MKYSVRRQMAALFIFVFIVILGGMFLVNAHYLEDFYISNKMNDLLDIYEKLRGAVEEESLDNEETREQILYEVERKNIDIIVLDGSGEIKLTTVNSSDPRYIQIIADFFGKGNMEKQITEQTDDYVIYKASYMDGETEYLKMAGFFSSNEGFIMRSPLASIRESANLANQFLVYIGFIGITLGGIAMWFFSKQFTKPIMKLAKLSQDMANLDFEAKYTEDREDEIGILGENFNKMSSQLEHTISELKRANNQLKQDIEQKEKLENMRNEFLGNVSHELKTPLALIQGYAEGLKEGVNDDPESREFYCEVIMDEAAKMNRMVRNLLTLNQLEFGDEELQFERFDLVGLIRGVIASGEILLQQAGTTVDFISDDIVYVWGDEFKTEQVLRNYLTNALHHIDNEKRIEVRVVHKGDKVRVSVFNSGKPIPEEDLPKLWEKFYKVDKAHTREYGGNGIGLSIVKAIMESFHQAYGVKNFDNGVEFWFELDAKSSEDV